MRRFGWAMALAASLAVGVLLAPYLHVTNTVSRTTASGSALASLDVNGESFIALPYSNPDLPLSTPGSWRWRFRFHRSLRRESFSNQE